MYKKFAYFTLAERLEEIPFGFSWIKKMPQKIIRRYILKKNPISIKEVSVLGTEGYEVQLPILLGEIDEIPQEDFQQILGQSIEELYQYDVDIISFPRNWNDIELVEVKIASGKEVIPIFLFMGIQKVLEFTKKSLKYLDIAIMDGKDKKTDFIIDYLYPHVNFLSIITDDPKRFQIKVKEIYGDVGLNLQVISRDNFHSNMADIIINLYPEPDMFFYYFKKGAVYFDLIAKPENIKNILLKRQDLLVIDDLLLKHNTDYISSTFCEMAWFVGNKEFRKYLLSPYGKGIIPSISTLPQQYNLEVAGVRQYGKTLTPSYLNQWVDKYLD